jgi:hypothetical protein
MPSKVTATMPGVGRAGKMHTRALSLHLDELIARHSPNTGVKFGIELKLEPNMVTSIPPCVGPEDGMRRRIFGVGVPVASGDGNTEKGVIVPSDCVK